MFLHSETQSRHLLEEKGILFLKMCKDEMRKAIFLGHTDPCHFVSKEKRHGSEGMWWLGVSMAQSGRLTVPEVWFDLLLSWSALPALLSLSPCRLTPHLRLKMKKQWSFWMPVFIQVGSSCSCNHLPNPDCWIDSQSLIFLCLTLHKTHNFSSAPGGGE